MEEEKIITLMSSQYRFQHFATAWEDAVVSIFVFVDRISPQAILDKFPVRGGCFKPKLHAKDKFIKAIKTPVIDIQIVCIRHNNMGYLNLHKNGQSSG